MLGWLLFFVLLVVVKCGVCVCLLLDDNNMFGFDDILCLFDSYLCIEVWFFNFFLFCLLCLFGYIIDFFCFNCCMYNKSFIVDGVVILVGG